jgi:hypothetical protein
MLGELGWRNCVLSRRRTEDEDEKSDSDGYGGTSHPGLLS